MLHQYCQSNNIKLYSFSWYNVENNLDKSFDDSSISNFSTFYLTNIKEINKFVNEYKKNNNIDF